MPWRASSISVCTSACLATPSFSAACTNTWRLIISCLICSRSWGESVAPWLTTSLTNSSRLF
ncbi:Uncharacterised protein [Bordetella pertussis]|nr:Uncharacterised protein [Bordetella pertussis]